MQTDSSLAGGVQTAPRPTTSRPAPRAGGRESRSPWRTAPAPVRAIVEVNPGRSTSPFSRLDLSGVTLGIFPHHD